VLLNTVFFNTKTSLKSLYQMADVEYVAELEQALESVTTNYNGLVGYLKKLLEENDKLKRALAVKDKND